MKKLLFIHILCICALSISAQVRVQNSGYMGIGAGAGTLLSRFSVGGLGATDATAYISSGTTHGLKIATNAYDIGYGLHAKATNCTSNGTAVGVQGEGQTNLSQGCSRGIGIGVRGIAGSISPSVPRAYGVSGLISANTGAGVYGGYGSTEAVLTGKYAGYFDGNVHVTGTVTATNIAPSDSRLKKNVLDLNYRQTLDKLMLLRPVEYNMQQVTFEADSIDSRGEEVTYSVNRYDETTPVFQHKHYGLIAQEMQKVYPDLVYEGSDGYLGIDYVSLIPMLLKVVQQQQGEIDELKAAITAPKLRSAEVIIDESDAVNVSVMEQQAQLYQNTPNPFNQSTQIKYYLPESVSKGLLCIYDLQGKQLKQTQLTQRGYGIETVFASEFPAGIYLYALLADGNQVDVKRMILTE